MTPWKYEDGDARLRRVEIEYRVNNYTALETDVATITTDRDRVMRLYLAARDNLGIAHVFLEREGYRRCDIAACNCGSWHRQPPQDVRYGNDSVDYLKMRRLIVDALDQYAAGARRRR